MKMHSILVFVLTLQTAVATSFYIRPFSEFTKTTPNIIRGNLINIHVENGATSEGEKTIYTFADLEIKDVIKGNISGTRIHIRKLGGSKDGVTLEIPSSVEFNENEEGVFFLGDEQEDHSYEVSSLELGKFNLVKKGGEEILTGGLFSYSQPRHDHDHGHDRDVRAENLEENLKPWSINQLKTLVQTQLSSVPPVTVIQKNADLSKPLAETQVTPVSTLHPQPKDRDSISEEKKDSPLYFGSAIWYSLATIILTLGVLGYLRRG